MATAWTDEGIGEWGMGSDTSSNHWDTWHLCGLPAWSFYPSISVTKAPDWSGLKPVLRLQRWVRCAPALSLPPVSWGVVVQSLRHAWRFATPWTAAQQAPVFHHLPELAQSHVHWVGYAIQPSHPLSSPSPPAFSLSQDQGIFQGAGLFISGSQSIEALASALVPPVNIQDWSPLELTGLISLQSKGFSRVFSMTGKTIALIIQILVGKVVSLLFNRLSRFVIALLSRSKCCLISWLQSPSTVILEPKKIKSVTVSTFFHLYLPWSDGTRCRNHSFLNIVPSFFECFKPTFSLFFFTIIKSLLKKESLFSSFLLYAINVVSSAFLRLLIFFPAILIPACASSSLALYGLLCI